MAIDILDVLSPRRPFVFGDTPVTDLVHSPAEVVRQLLVDLRLASEPPALVWGAYCDQEPDTPDKVVTVTDTAGLSFGWDQFTGDLLEFFGIQIRVRAGTFNTGFQKAREIAVALDENTTRATVTVDSSMYCIATIARAGTVLRLGKDVPNGKRSLFSINATVALRLIE